MKELFLDIETIGTDHKINPIIQIAGIVCDAGREIESFDFKCKPFEKDNFTLADLDFHVARGLSYDEIIKYQEAISTYGQLTRILDKYVDKFNKKQKYKLLGYNVNFDTQFMREWFVKCGNLYFNSYFWWPSVDVAVLAMDHLAGVRSAMSNFKQGTVARQLGIEVDESKLHDALYDIRICKQIYEKIKNRLVIDDLTKTHPVVDHNSITMGDAL